MRWNAIAWSSLMVLLGSTGWAKEKWEVLEDCTLTRGRYYDGDSFHIKHGGQDHILRLYFVDAPETSDTIKERVVEQQRYWRISESEVVKWGKEASRFTYKLLAADRFTVYTIWQDAKGDPSAKRYFAFVELGEDDFLGERLVEAGLARVYGATADRPNGDNQQRVWAKLERLENQARADKRGAWGGNPPPEHTKTKKRASSPVLEEVPATAPSNKPTRSFPEEVVKCRRLLPVYALDNPSKQIGIKRPGKKVTIIGEEAGGMWRIRYDGPLRGTPVEALCRKADLPR